MLSDPCVANFNQIVLAISFYTMYVKQIKKQKKRVLDCCFVSIWCGNDVDVSYYDYPDVWVNTFIIICRSEIVISHSVLSRSIIWWKSTVCRQYWKSADMDITANICGGFYVGSQSRRGIDTNLNYLRNELALLLSKGRNISKGILRWLFRHFH